MTDRKLDVQVIARSGAPVEGAIVWLYQQGKAEGKVKTGADGSAEIDMTDPAAWPSGQYSLQILPPGQSLVERRTLAVVDDGPPSPVLVTVPLNEDFSSQKGWNFLAVLTLILLSGLLGYLVLHGVTVEKIRQRSTIGKVEGGELSPALSDMLNNARRQAEAAKTIVETAQGATDPETEPTATEAGAEGGAEEQAAGEAGEQEEPPPGDGGPGEEETADGGTEGGGEESGEGEGGEGEAGETETDGADDDEAAADGGGSAKATDALADTGAKASLTSARKIYDGVKQSKVGLLDSSLELAIDELFDQAEAFVDAGKIEPLIGTLEELERQAQDRRTAFLWDRAPGRLFEVFFWALFATLLRLIFNTGYFLYKGTFLSSAIPHHISLLVTIPVVAVIIAFVLSLVAVTLKLGNTEVTLDMGNVLISVVVSSLIGLAPWKSWEFLRNLADMLFETLDGWFGKKEKTPEAP